MDSVRMDSADSRVDLDEWPGVGLVRLVESYERGGQMLAALASPVDDLVAVAAGLDWSPEGAFLQAVYADLGTWLGEW